MKLYILRHGQTDWNVVHRLQGRTDIALNANGRQVAHESGRGMKKKQIHFDRVISSPLSRSLETARIILDELGESEIPFVLDPRIIEIGFGIYEGYSVDGAHPEYHLPDPEWHFFMDDPSRYHPPAEAESFEELLTRTNDFLEELRAEADRETQESHILISTHGCASRALLYAIQAPSSGLKDFWLGGVPKNCAISLAQSQGQPWQLLEKDVIYDENV